MGGRWSVVICVWRCWGREEGEKGWGGELEAKLGNCRRMGKDGQEMVSHDEALSVTRWGWGRAVNLGGPIS